MRELHLTDVETEVQGNSTPCPEPLTALTGSRARMDSMCGGVLGSSLLQSTSFLLFWSSWKRVNLIFQILPSCGFPRRALAGCGVLGCVWTFLHSVLLRGPSEVPAGSGCFSGSQAELQGSPLSGELSSSKALLASPREGGQSCSPAWHGSCSSERPRSLSICAILVLFVPLH